MLLKIAFENFESLVSSKKYKLFFSTIYYRYCVIGGAVEIFAFCFYMW